MSINVSTGQKIKGSPFENNLISWIMDDPSISNNALKSKLEKNLNIKVSFSVIKAWRENYYSTYSKEVLQEIRDTLSHQELQKDEFNKSIASKVKNTIDFYLEKVNIFEQKIAALEEDQKTYREAHRKMSTEIERLQLEYYKLLNVYKATAYKFTGGVEYLQRLQKIIEEISKMAISEFYPFLDVNKKDECRQNFKKALKVYEENLYEELPKPTFQ
jgi:hypothetical protein